MCADLESTGMEQADTSPSPDLEGSRGSGGRTETVAQQIETLAGEVGHLAEMVEVQAANCRSWVGEWRDWRMSPGSGPQGTSGRLWTRAWPENGVHLSGSKGCQTQGS